MNEETIKRIKFLAGIREERERNLTESYKVLHEIEGDMEPIIDTTVQNIVSIPIIALSQRDLEASIMPDKLAKMPEEEVPVEEIKDEIENLVDAVTDADEEKRESNLELEIRDHAIFHLKEFLRFYRELNPGQKKKVRKILKKVVEKVKEE